MNGCYNLKQVMMSRSSLIGTEEYTARDRIKIARLLENMSGGTALAESMHGAGSPQAMKVMILRESNVEQKEQFAMDLAHVKL